jgi:hypothetical protein
LRFPHLPDDDRASHPPDLTLRLDESGTASLDPACHRSIWEHRERGRLSLSVLEANGVVVFRYHHGVDFVVQADRRSVVCHTGRHVDRELVRYLFLSLVAAFILHERNLLPLHAGAVRIGEEAVAFVAPAGGGKSSLTAYCVGAGRALISDDVLPLVRRGGEVLALPGPPQLRLWPDSAAALWADPATLPRHALRTEKRQIWLPLSDRYYALHPVRLRAVYVLERSEDRRVAVTPLTHREAVLALVSSAFGNFLARPERLARQLEWLAEAVAVVSCRRLRVPSGFPALQTIHERLVDDLSTLRPLAAS